MITLSARSQPQAALTDEHTVLSGRRAAPPLSLDDMVAVMKTMPYGGLDDAARTFQLPPQVRASISPLVLSLRWAAAMFGMIFGTKAALNGDLDVVVTLAVCLFVTTWRTTLPIRMASPRTLDRAQAFVDAGIVGTAVGFSGGPLSPFAFCAAATVVVASFGWGYVTGLGALVVSLAGMGAGSAFHGDLLAFDSGTALVVAGVLGIAALLPALARDSLLNVEQRRSALAGRLDVLAETNDLLTMLNHVARTLPTSLNLREALERAHHQITRTFSPSVVCLLELDESHNEWVPKLAEGCILRPTSTTADLPTPLRLSVDDTVPMLVSNLRIEMDGISSSSGSGLYVRLATRGRTVGLLGIEHPVPEHFGERDVALLAGLADLLALTLDNARWFGRLRSLGAEEERVRIARDLHDRLGQWLTYISFELERIIGNEPDETPELTRLYGDVQTALDELRETLRQLRSGVTDGRPLARVGQEVVNRFEERTDVEIRWTSTAADLYLPLPVENELLRILQEALSNIDKHAKATCVEASWQVIAGVGTLRVSDDGVGFDAGRGVRDSAYGLVGMRERADTIGGRLTIESTPGIGTTIVVTVGSALNETET